MTLDILHFEQLEARNFTILSPKEQEQVLAYRNHPDIRKWMYTSDLIPLENHLQFVSFLRTTMEQYYWLVQDIEKKEDIGVIYIKDINRAKKEAWFGIYANPNSKSKGRGTMLSKFELYIAFELLGMSKVFLSVQTSNQAAIKLYKKLGFEQDYMEDNYLFMYLNEENYAYRK